MRGMKKLLPAILTVAVVALVGCSREPSSLELAHAAAAVVQAHAAANAAYAAYAAAASAEQAVAAATAKAAKAEANKWVSKYGEDAFNFTAPAEAAFVDACAARYSAAATAARAAAYADKAESMYRQARWESKYRHSYDWDFDPFIEEAKARQKGGVGQGSQAP